MALLSTHDSASNRNVYQEHFLGVKSGRCVRLDNLTTILGHCHVMWEPQIPGTLWEPQTCNGTD